jgi:hypothetical protein
MAQSHAGERLLDLFDDSCRRTLTNPVQLLAKLVKASQRPELAGRIAALRPDGSGAVAQGVGGGGAGEGGPLPARLADAEARLALFEATDGG